MAKKSLIIFSIIIFVIASGCIITPDEPVTNNSHITKPTKNIKNKNISNDTIPPAPISYLRSKSGSNYINWAWDNPQDKDFDRVTIFIDGKFKINVSKPKNYFNLTGLTTEKQYHIGIRTVDSNKNMNPIWVNDSASTLPKYKDLIPPDKIWYLEAQDIGRTYINWTWENPEDADYSYANIYINDKFMINISKPKNFYYFTKVAPKTTYKIGVRTVDTNKNMNPIWVTDIETTLP